MGIGFLRKRMTLQAESIVADGAGGVTSSWMTLATVWGALVPVLSVLGKEGPSHKVTLRWRSDVTITPGMRLTLGSRIFTIHAVINVDERNQWLELRVEEGGLLGA